MTFEAPGSTDSAPTVATSPSPSRASRSTASTTSAAAASASWRADIGTVPAWPARPRRVSVARVCPAIAETTPDREPQFLEHGPLLDVHLEVARGPALARGHHLGRVATGGPDRLEHRDPVHVGQVEPRGVEAAGEGRRAEVGDAEPRALLVGEADHLDRRRRGLTLGGDPLHDRDAGENPERPVEAPRVGDRVEMRADHERRAVGARPGQLADDVAHGVAPHGHSRFLHPAGDELTRPRERRSREAPGEPVRLLADLAERRGAGEELGGRPRHSVGR